MIPASPTAVFRFSQVCGDCVSLSEQRKDGIVSSSTCEMEQVMHGTIPMAFATRHVLPCASTRSGTPSQELMTWFRSRSSPHPWSKQTQNPISASQINFNIHQRPAYTIDLLRLTRRQHARAGSTIKLSAFGAFTLMLLYRP